MAAEIKVGVGADVTDLEKGLKKGEKAVKDFSGTVGKIDLEKGIVKGANQAGNALTNLGRVAQDAPFGFIGIQNNLNPLLESFQRLKAEAGGNVGALKALAQSLMGPAGIGVAFSIGTAAITYFSQHPEKLDAILGSLIKTTNATSEAQRAYNDTLAESVSSVQGEIANINSLLSVARDENLSRNARLEAVKELNKNYPELNNQITLEGINSKKTTEAINGLNQALITRAKIQAVQELIGAEFKKQLESQNTAVQSQASFLTKATALLQLALPVQGAFAANSSLIASGTEEQNNQLKKSEQTLSEYQKILNGLNASLATSGNLFVDLPKKIKQAAETIKKEQPFKDIFSIQDQIFIKGGLKTPGLDTSTLQVANDQIENRRRELKARFQLMKDDMIDFNIELSNILNQGTIEALSGFGQAIGTALAQGNDVLQSVGKSLLSTVGGVLVQLGKLAIGVGVGIEAIKTALKTLNPVAAIGAGIALIALGSYFSSAAAGIGGGKGSSGGNFTPSVPSGFEASAPTGTRATASQNVFIPNTIIKGTDIVVSYNRQTALNGRTG